MTAAVNSGVFPISLTGQRNGRRAPNPSDPSLRLVGWAEARPRSRRKRPRAHFSSVTDSRATTLHAFPDFEIGRQASSSGRTTLPLMHLLGRALRHWNFKRKSCTIGIDVPGGRIFSAPNVGGT